MGKLISTIKESFCRQTDGRTYVRTDGHLRQALLCRLGGVDLKRKLRHPINA